jgi:threonine/homoserine/homoserine lactone efflux protein
VSIEFLLTSFIIVASPGTGVLYTLATGLARGPRASVVAAFGCTLGIVPHMAAAIVGLAALLHTSALAFQIFKYIGVAYLLYMAWDALREQGALSVDKNVAPRSNLRITVTAILINILNPKLSIFFLAFLPQFVDPAEGAVHWQILLLGLTFMGLGILSDGMFALAAGTAGEFLRRSRGFLKVQRWFAGTSFIGLGLVAAFATRK